MPSTKLGVQTLYPPQSANGFVFLGQVGIVCDCVHVSVIKVKLALSEVQKELLLACAAG